jgi:hypothetical protein
VSQGHRISLETAASLVHRCCIYRIPEPIRQADQRSREFLRRRAIALNGGKASHAHTAESVALLKTSMREARKKGVQSNVVHAEAAN